MSFATREVGGTATVLMLLMLCVSTWTQAPAAETAPTTTDDNLVAPETVPADAVGPIDADTKKDKDRREVARKVAAVSIILILVLIVFIVIVMIASRRLRARYLGWHKKIRFSKLWDVWWSKEKPKEKD